MKVWVWVRVMMGIRGKVGVRMGIRRRVRVMIGIRVLRTQLYEPHIIMSLSPSEICGTIVKSYIERGAKSSDFLSKMEHISTSKCMFSLLTVRSTGSC